MGQPAYKQREAGPFFFVSYDTIWAELGQNV
jgi:hypothetical protein